MPLFGRGPKKPERIMLWVDTRTEKDAPADERYVLTIRRAYAGWADSGTHKSLLFKGAYPSRWRRWRALRGWWRKHRKEYWYSNFMVDFDAWT